MPTRTLGRGLLAASIVLVALALVPSPGSAGGKKLGGGAYSGTITPTDSSDSNSDTDISFKVNGAGSKIKRLKAEFFYGCFIGGSYTLQPYTFPAVHKGPIKIKRNGSFKAKDVVDKETGFIVYFAGKTKGSSKATGTIELQTTTTGNGCGRDFTWSATG